MCGIIAYTGNKDAAAIVLEGLKKLEYRGYDSWGIAALAQNSQKSFSTVKKVGKIGGITGQELKAAITEKSSLAIGHTRWATHGGVTEQNAHPHLDCTGKIAVAHNGIVENYQQIRAEIDSNGREHRFSSQTDTEIIPHLIEDLMRNKNLSFEEAVRYAAASKIQGRSAFVAIDSDSGSIMAVRKGSPLIVGVHENSGQEFFVASDVTAFLDHTNQVMYLDDNEGVIISTGKAKFFDLNTGEAKQKRTIDIHWHQGKAEKEGYDHFLIKEIMEQKHTIAAAINQDDGRIQSVADAIKNAFGTFFVGCGTAGKVCMAGEYLFSKIAKKHVNSIVASEFSNYQHYLTPKTLMVAVSQSGETADVLEAIEVARSNGVKIISLLNVFGSTMMRASDDFFMVNAGAERAVVSTKATTAQLAVLTLLAYAAAGRLQEGKLLLMNTASAVNDMLNPRYEERIKELASLLQDKKDIFIIGRGMNCPIALEAAIKLQETCYIHAQGFAAGELKHGPLALIGEGTPCIAIVANDETRNDTLNSAAEVKARGGYVIGISPENSAVFDYWLKVPDAGNASPIVNIIPVQILAYHLAILKGCDPDYPRNLAKVCTTK